MKGVVRTRVGYSGGTSDNPTYRNLGGHSEAIQIDYDPGVISYKELLDIFWDSHDPTSQAWSRQYRKAIFYHSEEQKGMAEASRDMLDSVTRGKIITELLPFEGFYLAEGYHQKHNLRNFPTLMEEYEAKYPRVEDLVSSTAVSRVNGYLGGNGSCDELKSEIVSLGLSEGGKKTLLENVCVGNIDMTCPTQNCS